jgi:hypothetical protein
LDSRQRAHGVRSLERATPWLGSGSLRRRAFDAVYARALRVPLDATTAPVVALDDLITLKRASGRPLDLSDIEALLALSSESGP